MKCLFSFSLFIITLISNTNGQTKISDSLKLFSPCSEPISYSVNDDFVKEYYGQILKTPDINPIFIGGPEELKKYFITNQLTDLRAKGIVFRAHIGFIIDCAGKSGNFELLNKGEGDLQILDQQILNIVKNMPQNWHPAIVNNKPVDCYQILSFTVSGGAFVKVSYR